MNTIDINTSINNYLADNNTDPLYFHKLETPVTESVKNNVQKLVKFVLIQIWGYHSYNRETKTIQTKCAKFRSAIDIYRHCLDINPEISFLQVMTVLVNTSCIHSLYCTDIRRRVFVIKTNHNFGGIFDVKRIDEFGLTLVDWRNITNG